jgi:hypothetical protein
MKLTQNAVIATRRLRGPVGMVVISLGKPRKAREIDWECPYRIRIRGVTKVRCAHGLDGVQALILAIEAIGRELETYGGMLSWEGGEHGDTGFPRFIPNIFGLKPYKRLVRLVDRQIERIARKTEERRRSGHGRKR